LTSILPTVKLDLPPIHQNSSRGLPDETWYQNQAKSSSLYAPPVSSSNTSSGTALSRLGSYDSSAGIPTYPPSLASTASSYPGHEQGLKTPPDASPTLQLGEYHQSKPETGLQTPYTDNSSSSYQNTPYQGMTQHQDWAPATSHSYAGPSYPPHSAGHTMHAYSSYQPHYSGGAQPGYSYAAGQMLSPLSNHGGSSSLGMLPGIPNGTSAYSQPHGSSYGSQHHAMHDATGQVAPPGSKSKITATLWEDEGTVCFQVESNGLCVARREDNHFINGTKLLNVAGMTRGRRDGILKSEKTRNVVKIGPMHLKGVWIPFERALEFANREKITDKLYPLFVHNISNFVPQSQNGARPGGQLVRGRGGQPAMSHLGHSMIPSMPQHPSMQLPSQIAGRPVPERAHTFPTPPTSAASVVNSGTEFWNQPNMSNGVVQNTQPLHVDTTSTTARSMPSTPASTPPGHQLSSTTSYSTAHTGASYPSQYGISNGYMKNEMGPPTRSNTLPSNDPKDVKNDPYASSNGGPDTVGHEQNSYAHEAHTFGNGHHNSYSFTGVPSAPQMQPTQSEPSDGLNGATHHDTSTGQITPRASVSNDSWGYQTPPRTNTYPSYPSTLINNNKRARDEDDAYKLDGSVDGAKRRKSLRDDMNAPRPGMLPVGR